MRVIEVKSRRDYQAWLNLPSKIYKKNSMPHMVHLPKPLVKMLVGKVPRPRLHLLMGEIAGEIVARVGFKVHKHGGEVALHFGFFEALQGSQSVVKEMFDYAHRIYPDLKIRGPYHFRMEDPFIGTLVEGSEHDPYFLMSYNPTYYGEILESCGLYKSMDLLTYDVEVYRNCLPEGMNERARKAREKGFDVRQIDPKHMKDEVRKVARIFNDALSSNWGFEEMLDDQVKDMYMLFKLFLDHRLILFACKDGKEVACLICLPNLNPILKKSGGKITLGLIIDMLTKRKKVDSLRGYALGVLSDYHGNGLGSLLIHDMFDRAVDMGVTKGEISWVLSNNNSMNSLANDLEGKQNKVYRIYDRDALQ